MRPGAKYFEWERRGVPLRLEIGPRDVAQGQAIAASRHDGQKRSIPLSGLTAAVQALLDEAQAALRARARTFREQRTEAVDDRAALAAALAPGYAFARWCEDVTLRAGHAAEHPRHRALLSGRAHQRQVCPVAG